VVWHGADPGLAPVPVLDFSAGDTPVREASLILPPQGSLRAREALYFPHAHFNHTPLSTGGDAVIWAP
jgi:hypothetical protein